MVEGKRGWPNHREHSDVFASESLAKCRRKEAAAMGRVRVGKSTAYRLCTPSHFFSGSIKEAHSHQRKLDSYFISLNHVAVRAIVHGLEDT